MPSEKKKRSYALRAPALLPFFWEKEKKPCFSQTFIYLPEHKSVKDLEGFA